MSEEKETLYSVCLGKVEAEICLPIISDLIAITLIVGFSIVLTYFLLFGNPCVCVSALCVDTHLLPGNLIHLFVFLLTCRGN